MKHFKFRLMCEASLYALALFNMEAPKTDE